MKEPLILAIDTSCDETSVSVVIGLTVLSNVMPSQMSFHKKYGGVVPSLAKFAHEQRIDDVVRESLKLAQVEIEKIDVFAVTIGPGLAIALEVGIRKAKELSQKYNKPLIVVNHMEGHLLSAFAERRKSKIQNSKDQIKKFEILNPKSKINLKFPSQRLASLREEIQNSKQNENVTLSEVEGQQFPVLGFLISGGHTELILVNDFLDYKKIGDTIDDSCGEAYDKTGRILGLGYPGGPVISEFARRNRRNISLSIVKQSKSTIVLGVNKNTGIEYTLPISMVNSGDLNFSYSGLKTAVKYLVSSITGSDITLKDQLSQDVKGLTKEQIYDLCVVFEAAAIEQLKFKLRKAITKYKPKEIWIGGGVTASSRLRSELRKVCKEYEIGLKYPYSNKLTGDNAVMIAVAAVIKVQKLGGIDKIISSLEKDSSIFESENIFIQGFENIDRQPNLSF
jgi:N6-L-threonylcarbamoyladenine synthase